VKPRIFSSELRMPMAHGLRYYTRNNTGERGEKVSITLQIFRFFLLQEDWMKVDDFILSIWSLLLYIDIPMQDETQILQERAEPSQERPNPCYMDQGTYKIFPPCLS